MDLVPETFVDRLGEVSLKEGMVRIELVSLSGSEPRVTQRLVMSLQAFLQTLQVQHNMVQRLEQAGIIAVQPAAAPDIASAATATTEAMSPSSGAVEAAAAPDTAAPRSPNFAKS